MKTRKLLLTLCVFLATFLVGGISLALEAPTLTLRTSGTTVSLSWTSVAGATGYTLSYAPSPYTGPDSIKNIPMGTQTSISASLSVGAAFYVAVQAYDSAEISGYSNLESFIILATFKNSLGQEFKLIPAGTFTMGSPSDEPGRDLDEGPQHIVTLTQPFYMMTTEVTQAQWEAVMGSNPSRFSGCPNCPVETVSWDDVQKFISVMNEGEWTYGLPTEAQWEYAARAGSTTAFYNGGITETGGGYDQNLDAIGWYTYNATSYETNPVAQKEPNAWGLYDMSGNVFEWCRDFYDIFYYDSSSSMTDPTGPSSGFNRVYRGGHWSAVAEECRNANRDNGSPDIRSSRAGFRLVLEIEASPSPPAR